MCQSNTGATFQLFCKIVGQKVGFGAGGQDIGTVRGGVGHSGINGTGGNTRGGGSGWKWILRLILSLTLLILRLMMVRWCLKMIGAFGDMDDDVFNVMMSCFEKFIFI